MDYHPTFASFISPPIDQLCISLTTTNHPNPSLHYSKPTQHYLYWPVTHLMTSQYCMGMYLLAHHCHLPTVIHLPSPITSTNSNIPHSHSLTFLHIPHHYTTTTSLTVIPSPSFTFHTITQQQHSLTVIPSPSFTFPTITQQQHSLTFIPSPSFTFYT
ncbi:hypothetical protein Pcinc_004782 [Petrolisthes cinctipes]|uniref:Uncharacterized protein n=1 Tax=Petrolisthes cinctipes TaxID=88211 RepID=A0AAE1FXK0_PETCI|nr:hypothetical protein Pcinc_014176 [Petrolisthes cinctipes]KAK3891339.1 hypothetical protein Pcinc_004782 [Petrolisthes cinctipes]